VKRVGGDAQQAAQANKYEVGASPRAPAWLTHYQYGALETAPLRRRTRTYGMGQWQAPRKVPGVPGLNVGTLGEGYWARAAAPDPARPQWCCGVGRSKSAFRECAYAPLGRRSTTAGAARRGRGSS